MIITQHPFINDNEVEFSNLVRTYSDSGLMLRQIETDILYSEAVDVYPSRYTYEEADIPIEQDPREEI